jgi:hypothetical protein
LFLQSISFRYDGGIVKPFPRFSTFWKRRSDCFYFGVVGESSPVVPERIYAVCFTAFIHGGLAVLTLLQFFAIQVEPPNARLVDRWVGRFSNLRFGQH